MATGVVVALGVVGGLFGLVVLLALVGMLFPRDHVATRTLRLRRAPAEVWKVVTDLGGQLTWRADLKGVSKVSEAAREQGMVGEVWREQFGRHAFELATREAIPPDPSDRTPGRMVRELITPGLAFRGRWEYVVAPGADGGSVVTLTEHGTVTNPVFRAVGRLTGQARHLDRYLVALARRFGEPARLG